MNIYLTGYRATGKSTVADLLAGLLQWPLLDTDQLVEKETGMSIAEIFSSLGEVGFREREYQALCQCSGLDKHVIALGGGAVISAANRDVLRGTGPMVWLTATVETILERLGKDPMTASRRPDLVLGGGEEEVRRLLEERVPVYQECADLVMPTDQSTPEEVAGKIVAWLDLQPSGGR